ncbi:MAG: hypothetical protein ABIW31_00390 [Novosphingobium sp.]
MGNRIAGATLFAALCLACPNAHAATYGETLLTAVAHRHSSVRAIEIDASGNQGALVRLSTGRKKGQGQILTLKNALGESIGTVTVTLRDRGAPEQANAVAHDLSRHIYTAANLVEPDPFVSGARRSPRAQALVDRALEMHPSLVTLAMHVALPDKTNQIIASNFGRIGKAADKDDEHVIADGAILKEMTNGGKRLAIEMPLLDRKRRTIGALSTSFMITDMSADKAYAEALTLRDELAGAIPPL